MAEPSLTVSGITDEVSDIMYSYVRDQAQVTSLSTVMDSSQLTFTASEPNQVSRGLIEIDDELIAVSVASQANGVCTIQPWGRAQSGSSAAAHSIGAKVTQSPLYPRQRIKNVIYGVLREIFPDIYGVSSFNVDVNLSRTNYPAPSDAWNLLRVEWLLPGPSQMWSPVKRWRQNKTPTTVELELIGPVWPGPDRVRCLYAKVPPATVTEDDLTTLGYSEEIRDVLIKGTVAHLLAYTEPSRLQIQSAQAHGRSEAVPAGSIANLSKFFYGIFKQRVKEEAEQLNLRYPIQPHFTR